ncbi:OmpA family protein [Mucilaginibacter xinganensis]|uniref:OmpA-OmpF porin, OOP family n=1 Tax=Mucilaginibacter xinganensis TaxID=1234841 RepID=A0A223P345_9SPHI|nr:OmpA family protein [Mucilaginibacter xinganensis]ASU36569.1 OmpA-OmpF porin, OOP family [Mucilaginibacter xinganensis]
MKHLQLKKASLLLTGLVIGGRLFAQTPDSTKIMTKDYVQPFSDGSAFRTWSVGFEGGVLTPYSIFGIKNQDVHSPHEKIGYGGFIKDQILPSFGIQANFLTGNVGGAVTSFNEATGGYTSFNTKLNYAVDLAANFTLANINWRHNKSAIQPYLTVGGGVVGYSAVVNNNGTEVTQARTHEFYLPVGAGFKIDLAKGVNLDLGYQVNFVNADNFDGIVTGSTNDRFSYGHIGLEFALGSRSKPQLATHNPVASMRTEYLMDEQRLQIQVDQQKAKNQQLASDLANTNAKLDKLTVDSDGDGVIDMFDKCPNTPAGTQVDGAGCPLPVKKPDVKVYVTQEDRKVVSEAVKNLEFDFGKSTIRDHSFESLNKLAQLLVSKGFNLKLAGYTDNVGSTEANLKLSRERAEAVKTYLATQGADASKIQAEGYGKSNPIATNKTEKGRQINRRVEFSMF